MLWRMGNPRSRRASRPGSEEMSLPRLLGRISVRTKKKGHTFDLASGILFDLLLVTVALGLIWMCAAAFTLAGEVGFEGVEPSPTRRAVSPARRVSGTRKKVRFNVPRKGRLALPTPETPFLGGPRHAWKIISLGNHSRRHEFDQEGFALLLSRYSQSTAASYQSQWGWWSLFCRRRGDDPVRHVPAYKPGGRAVSAGLCGPLLVQRDKGTRNNHAETGSHPPHALDLGVS